MNTTRPPAWRSNGRTPRLGYSEVTISKVVCRVLAPPEAPGKKPRIYSDVTPAQGLASSGDFWSSTTSFASQLLSHFKVPAFAAPSPDAVLREASTKERELQRTKAPVDVSQFLSPVGIWEVKHLRKLSSLTALTYYMHLVTPRRLHLLHGLELVTTSRACDIRPYEHNKTAEEVGADGDGMAVSVDEARQVYQALKWGDGGTTASARAGASDGAGGSSSNIVTLTRDMPYQLLTSPGAAAGPGPSWPVPSQVSQLGQAPAANGNSNSTGASGSAVTASPMITPPAGLPQMLRSPAEAMASKLTEAAVAASAAAAAAENFYVGLASLPIGSALVGANNRASNALLQSSSAVASVSSSQATAAESGQATSAALGESSMAQWPSGSAPSSSGPSAVPGMGADAWAGAGFLGGGRKATAAGIAAMTTERIRQQALMGFAGSARGGMAAVSASGLLTSLPSSGASAAAGAASPGSAATALAAAASAGGQSSAYLCPSEWFVVDDTASATRTFVIQGSDTLDHWKLNLTFDPVVFEDPSLGVKVHRGVYEAALVLYDRFLPLVYEHLESSPFSKIAFTGHSVGGSLATLLMLMYRVRGVLPAHSIATLYTFGAPSVLCQTQPLPQANGHQHHKHHSHHDHHPKQDGSGHANGHANGHRHSHQHQSHNHGPSHHLAATKVNGHHHPEQQNGNGDGLVNGHDRANGHGYDPHHHSHGHRRPQADDHISDLEVEVPSPAAAASLGPARQQQHPHPHRPSTSSSPFSFGGSYCSCSSDDLLERLGLPPSIVRNVLMARDVVPRAFACDYSPVADILRSWGASFKEHCCLSRTGRKHLYFFVGRMCILQPDSWHTFVNNDPDHPMLPPGPELYYLTEPSTLAPASQSVRREPHQRGPRSSQPPAQNALQAHQQPPRAVARSVMEAVWELMDCPHPLETLADPGAYMASGIISRYHNPEHYTKALGRVRYLKRQAEKRTATGAADGAHSAALGSSMEAITDEQPGGTEAEDAAAAAAAAAAGRDAEGVVAAAVARAKAASRNAGGSGGGGKLAPWDSSDGLDSDLHGCGIRGSLSTGGGDAHAHAHVCR